MAKEYYIKNRDIMLTEDGDLALVITPTEDNPSEGKTDMSTIRGAEEISQNAMFRIRTNVSELMMHEAFGSRLLDILGKRNTRENAELGKTYLRDAILRDNYVINPDHLEIDAVPISPEEILYVVKILNGLLEPIKIVLQLNLKDGIRRVL